MGRPRLHADDTVLDAARDLVVAGGGSRATTAAVSERSAVPVGSLYHRFGSREALLAEVWLRTVRRFQVGLLRAAAAAAPGLRRAVATAAWTLDFATAQPADSRLLLLARREDLLREAALPPAVRTGLRELNEPVARLLDRLVTEVFGRDDGSGRAALTIAVVDLPYAHVRRHLLGGTDPSGQRASLLRAVRLILEEAQRNAIP